MKEKDQSERQRLSLLFSSLPYLSPLLSGLVLSAFRQRQVNDKAKDKVKDGDNESDNDNVNENDNNNGKTKTMAKNHKKNDKTKTRR